MGDVASQLLRVGLAIKRVSVGHFQRFAIGEITLLEIAGNVVVLFNRSLHSGLLQLAYLIVSRIFPLFRLIRLPVTLRLVCHDSYIRLCPVHTANQCRREVKKSPVQVKVWATQTVSYKFNHAKVKKDLKNFSARFHGPLFWLWAPVQCTTCTPLSIALPLTPTRRNSSFFRVGVCSVNRPLGLSLLYVLRLRVVPSYLPVYRPIHADQIKENIGLKLGISQWAYPEYYIGDVSLITLQLTPIHHATWMPLVYIVNNFIGDMLP